MALSDIVEVVLEFVDFANSWRFFLPATIGVLAAWVWWRCWDRPRCLLFWPASLPCSEFMLDWSGSGATGWDDGGCASRGLIRSEDRARIEQIPVMTDLLLRVGTEADIDALLEVERRAAALLLGHGAYDLFAMHSLLPQNLRDGIAHGILRVAEVGGQPVGFALCGEVDGQAHLFEMDVVPEHGRSGIGSALLESVCSEAAVRGFSAMTLTTLRDVPWNAPFYAARGFVEMDQAQWGEELGQIVARERMLGFPMRLRVVMRRPLPGG
jgi:GNAT superfamily N-acetyltransferase